MLHFVIKMGKITLYIFICLYMHKETLEGYRINQYQKIPERTRYIRIKGGREIFQ